MTTSKTRPEKLIVIYGFIFQSRGARAVFQFYPENSAQIEMITSQAMKSGFTGGILVDYPNSTKAKKFFLVLMTGGIQQMPRALGTGDDLEAGSRNQVRIALHLIIINQCYPRSVACSLFSKYDHLKDNIKFYYEILGGHKYYRRRGLIVKLRLVCPMFLSRSFLDLVIVSLKLPL